jgi:hypothetical protein
MKITQNFIISSTLGLKIYKNYLQEIQAIVGFKVVLQAWPNFPEFFYFADISLTKLFNIQ